MILANRIKKTYFGIIFLVVLTGCSVFGSKKSHYLFRKLPAHRTGINFSNHITSNANFNFLKFPYIYNGGGVAIGDINNDGRPDIYFTGNMVSSRLYLNEGNFKFKDITKTSGTSTHRWCTGVSMVDINHDGYLDIYVSVSGESISTAQQRTNLLFINNGDNTFTELAANYGLADTGFTTQTAFFDYDKDRDLDVFMIENDPNTFSRNKRVRNRLNRRESQNIDVLYRNNGDGTFTDVSKKAGISKAGFSLGVAICDFNKDSWPDIYISNDIQSNDVLYINNGDGTFTDKANTYFKHTSYAGMGIDAADFNNDGWADLLQVGMRPPSLYDQQLVTNINNYQNFRRFIQKGYQYQYSANSLQLSNGKDNNGNVIFSEISHLANVSATNWSWSGLFADFDNDGYKDIIITTGYPKALNNHDYAMKISRAKMFGTHDAQKEKISNIIDDLAPYKLHNYFFKNNGDLTFLDVSKKWGFVKPTFSYGASYADLDDDGDLDIVINNINGMAGVYQNTANKQLHNHHIEVDLKGNSFNPQGIGARIKIVAGDQIQYATIQPTRGYESSVPAKLHFGLGNVNYIDTLIIRWSDGHYQRLIHVRGDTTITLFYKNSKADTLQKVRNPKSSIYFVNVTDKLNIHYKHQENTYNDYRREPLLPHMLSRRGPAIAVGDVNNDDREDFYVGGAADQSGKLYIQQKDGTFRPSTHQQAFEIDKQFEDTGALFFDANGDGFLDLYVVSGGYGLSPLSSKLQDRLYMNNGTGKFVQKKSALPKMFASGSCVKAGDYDGDGDLDLFIGSRVVPGKYPLSPQSYILRNDGGIFKNVTKKIAPGLQKGGMITDAMWMDFNGDGFLDLITAGEWAPIRFYKNNDGKFNNITKSMGLGNKIGWWSSLVKGDFDNDGDMDIIAGNFGLNSRYSTPDLEIIIADFDQNGIDDAITAIHNNNGVYPLAGKLAMGRQLNFVNQRFRSFEDYAAATVTNIVGKIKTKQYQINTMASSYLKNKGRGTFTITPLPIQSQFSSINSIIPYDVNNDGNLDIIVGGNMYETNPNTTRNDASNGLWLEGDGMGHFYVVPPIQSGYMTPGDVKDLALIHTGNGTIIIVGNNNSLLQVYKIIDR